MLAPGRCAMAPSDCWVSVATKLRMMDRKSCKLASEVKAEAMSKARLVYRMMVAAGMAISELTSE